ncbi:MAG: peptide-methionine (S)-S-oxide reductase MsrA [Burkholderiales bacterium]|nr:peptide-methionine (S)-S-oxide reductase MsrA [Burkholderiales bacterium]
MNTDRNPLPSRAPLSTRRRIIALAAVGLVAVAGLQLRPGLAAESALTIPPLAGGPAGEATTSPQTVVFAGGCFWGVQGVFQHTKGVLQAVSGYAGGNKNTASYEIVSSGLTGHAESVQVTYDPKVISYPQLLQIYFSVVHDPTELNRQGPDHGTQYRSEVFYTDAYQKQATERYIAQLDAAKVFPAKIVTQVAPLAGFYPAEGYHQNYATLHPDSGYIATFDLPKIANLKRLYPAWYRADPVLVALGGAAATARN